MTLPTVFTPSGFRVEVAVGGGGDLGAVLWVQTGHAAATVTGMAALVAQVGGYLAGLPALPPAVHLRAAPTSGQYTVFNADLAAQQAAIAAILSVAGNTAGNPN